MNLALIGGLGGTEVFLIFLAVLLLFGAKKIPELARGLGKSLGEFRKAKDEFDREIHTAAEETNKPKLETKSSPDVVGRDDSSASESSKTSS